jgi:acyl-CoA thioesterase-1
MNAVGGTGFTNPGACGDAAFSTRIPTVLATKPQMLLVQGGLNDFGARPADLERAANAFLDRVKSVPHVVLVGPTDAPARSAGARTVDEVLARVAAAHHVEYVSTFGWRDQFNAEGLHLTAAGQRDYAAQLAAAIR